MYVTVGNGFYMSVSIHHNRINMLSHNGFYGLKYFVSQSIGSYQSKPTISASDNANYRY